MLLFFYLCDSIKVFYGSGDCLVLNIPTSDSDDIPEIVRRLEEISIGCQVGIRKVLRDKTMIL